MSRRGWLLAVGLAVAAMAVPGRCLSGQDIAVPVDVHLPLLVKLLNFDRNLPARVQGQINVGVLYQGRFRTSAKIADGVSAAIGQLDDDVVGGYPVHVVPLDLDAIDDLGRELARHKLQVLYVTPMRALDLEAITRQSRAARVLTVTGVPQYVDAGLSVGIDRKGERAQIVVNLPSSRAEGADFTAQLLKLVRVIDK